MKSKIEMAHDYAMLHMMMDRYKDVDDLEMIQWANDYADAMQAEADKREEEKALRDAESHKTFMDMLNQKEQNYHDDLVSIGLEDWQPDWSQAPEWANWWAIGCLTGQGVWSETKPICVKFNGVNYWEVAAPVGKEHLSPAPSFDYKGDWKDSLRKRP